MIYYNWLKRLETLLDKHAYLDVKSDIHSLNLEEAWSLYIYLLEVEGK
jgi:hypothetical protein